MAITSVESMPNRGTKQSRKSSTLRLPTAMPLGTPVDVYKRQPVFHEEGYHFEIGKGEVLREGKDVAIIATGIMVPEAIEAGKVLAQEGIDAMVINMATIKPLDEELVLSAAKKCGKDVYKRQAKWTSRWPAPPRASPPSRWT